MKGKSELIKIVTAIAPAREIMAAIKEYSPFSHTISLVADLLVCPRQRSVSPW